MDDIYLNFNLLYKFNNTTEINVGDVLISNPINVYGMFYKSVVLITEHDEFGTTGFILNKITNINPVTIYDDLNCRNFKIFYGGPVNLNKSYILYFNDELIQESNKITQNLYYSSNLNIINDLCDKKFKSIIGNAVWGPDQLLQEIYHDSWAVYKPTNIESIFKIHPEELWEFLTLKLGNRYKIFINYPSNYAMN